MRELSKAEIKLAFNYIQSIIDVFSPCMDDYLYIYDITNDSYYISKSALERFAIPESPFQNFNLVHKQFIHPDDQEKLIADIQKVVSGSVNEHCMTYRWIGKDGEAIWINCRGKVVYDTDGDPVFMMGCINEVGQKQIADNVSGLLEMSEAMSQIEKMIFDFEDGFIMRVGIDDFKSINDKFGANYGDLILKNVAECINEELSPNQSVYKAVSDEFIIIDVLSKDEGEAKRLYKKIRMQIDKSIEKNDYKTIYTISAGVVFGKGIKEYSLDEVKKISTFALSEAKNRGRNQLYAFEANDYEAFLKKREILVKMRKAVSTEFEGFDLFFQPIVQTKNEQIFGAESLLRFWTSDKRLISPAEFIPVLEESGLIIPVGKWVIDRALYMCKEVQKTVPDFKISVNISYVQILKSSVFKEIKEALIKYDLKPSSLIVELTESGYLENSPAVRNVWKELKNLGVMIAIDDFGTGYSNLSSIGNMLPDIIKLDRGFTVKALQDNYEYRVMSHVVELVHSIDLKICVEGIETADELKKFEGLNADCIQGYYYGKPCCSQEFMSKFIETR